MLYEIEFLLVILIFHSIFGLHLAECYCNLLIASLATRGRYQISLASSGAMPPSFGGDATRGCHFLQGTIIFMHW